MEKATSLSETKSGALCMENATLHQLDTNERLVLCLENVMRIQWDANEYLVYRTYHSPAIGQKLVGLIW